MSSGAELILLFAGLHLFGLLLASLLFIMFLRSDTVTPWSPPEDGDDGGGGSDRPPPHTPSSPRDGGLPLPDAAPARVRLRERGRLSDLLPKPHRRPTHPPSPVRTPGRRTPSRG